MSERVPVVVKAGLGVESTGLICGMIERGELIDAIIFADTGAERDYTYKVRDGLNTILRVHGYPEIVTVTAQRAGVPITLEHHCLTTKKMPSKSYGLKSCSQRFKAEPAERWIAQWAPAKATWAAGEKVLMLIGYNVDEVARYTKAPPPNNRYAYDYPLVRWRWTRNDCLAAAGRFGLSPRKSACYFCGSARPPEVRKLREEAPDLFARGLAIEQTARPFSGSIRGLGQNFAWSDIVDSANRQERLFANVLGPATYECECHEGGDDDE